MTEPGHVLNGRYRLDRRLGHGAQGAVWIGHDLRLDCRVAVKVASPRVAGEPSAELERHIARFHREAQAMARIRNRPHVAVIYDHGEDDEILYSVMEYIDGTPLSAHTGQGRQLTLEQTLRWTRHICEGLADAHDADVIHRDVKPSNIVIDANGLAKVVDFGLAHLLNASSTRNPGWGTLHYAAPERLDGQAGTARSDLYSLGCVVYEMITGWSPFAHHRDPVTVMWDHAAKVPDRPRDLRPGVPRPLDHLVMSLLEKKPDARPTDARTVTAALHQIEYVSDDAADPHVDTRHVAEIQRLELFIQQNATVPWSTTPDVLDARARHAHLTGESGDPRGAAALYQRLAQDCARLVPPDEDRSYEAYREASRWKQRPA